ncbi:hypothetical protein DER45DRAFT_568509 [Fusarium avenaceum]|nr:hypothetical protein DER45DRAFT_568509 [Fusarium avenaceum]
MGLKWLVLLYDSLIQLLQFSTGCGRRSQVWSLNLVQERRIDFINIYIVRCSKCLLYGLYSDPPWDSGTSKLILIDFAASGHLELTPII